jgi:hypothetical protein
VTVRQRRLPGVRTRRMTWIAWGGVREAQAGDGGDLQGADLDPPVAMVAGAIHDWDLPPRQPGQLSVQTRLVGLDDQQVVGAATDQEAGVVALGVQRVGSDHDPGKVQAGQQRLEGGHFTRRAVDFGHQGTLKEPWVLDTPVVRIPINRFRVSTPAGAPRA